MPYCQQCGAATADDAKFCANCGVAILATDASDPTLSELDAMLAIGSRTPAALQPDAPETSAPAQEEFPTWVATQPDVPEATVAVEEELPTWVAPDESEIPATQVAETVTIARTRPTLNVLAVRVLAGIGLILGVIVVLVSLYNDDTPPDNQRIAAERTATPTPEAVTAQPTPDPTPDPTAPPTPQPTFQQALPPAPEPTPVPQPQSQCHPSYEGACLDQPGDYDCAGGSGNGPNYTGPVRVVGPDEYDLDRDGDGEGCE